MSPESIVDLTAAAFLQELGTITNGKVSAGHGAENVAQIVGCVAELKDAADTIRYHCENFDGSGNPLGLIGEQIPLTARVLRVAKEFELLIVPENDGPSLSLEQAFARLLSGKGREFDPRVVTNFSEVIGEVGLSGYS